MIKRNFTWKNYFLFFVTAVSLALLVTPASTQIVEVMSQQEELTIRRETLLREEGIRLLYSEGKYYEVIREAEELIAMDENNSTALLLKDRSEQRIASSNTEAPRSNRVSTDLTEQEKIEIQRAKDEHRDIGSSNELPSDSNGEEAQPESTPEPPPVVPVYPPSSSGGLSPIVYVGAIVVVIIGLIILIFVVLRLMKSRKEAQAYSVPAPTNAMAPLPRAVSPARSAMSGLGINDVPTMSESLEEFDAQGQKTEAQESTAVHDMVTRPDQVAASQKAARDPETGLSDEDMGLMDEDTGLAMDPGTGFPDEDTGLADIGTGLSLDPGTGFADPSTGLVFDGPEEDEVSSLGIDYSSTDEEVYSESQGLDVQKTKGDALAPSHDETEVEADEGSTVDISLSFGASTPQYSSTEETKTSLPEDDEVEADAPSSLDIGLPMGPEEDQQGASEEDLTYNSLMFGGGDATGSQENSREESDEELTQNSFNKEYSNLMFGDGAADTQMPIPQNQDPDAEMHDPSTSFGDDDTAIGDASTALGDKDTSLGDPSTALGDKDTSLGDSSTALGDPDTSMGDPSTGLGDPDTSMGDPSTSFGDEDTKVSSKKAEQDLEKTLTITKPAQGSAPKMGMFEKQREAGRLALDEENYGKAVQALSVAASLKPADKEVRAMLDEARKKRRGV
jgi:hypothetical protein